MKKILLSIVILSINWQANAQLVNPLPLRRSLKGMEDVKHLEIKSPRATYGKTNDIASVYYDFAYDAAVAANGGDLTNFKNYVNIVFHDSTPMVSSEQGNRHVHYHKIGIIFDPTSDFFVADDNGVERKLTPFTPYNVDSVIIGGTYDRLTTDDIGDTLQVEIVWGKPAKTANTNVFAYQGNFINEYKDKKFSLILNKPSKTSIGNVSAPASFKRVIKYILTANDTGRGNIRVGLDSAGVSGSPAPLKVPAGQIVGIAYTFIPGHVVHEGDIAFKYGGGTTEATINSFRASVIGPSDQNDNTTYFYDETSKSNCEELITYSRYGLFTGGNAVLNNCFLPDITIGYRLGLRVTADNTGIKDDIYRGVKLSQNMPNPFSCNTIIDYNINENSSVSVEISDITGKNVMTIDEGKKNAGVHSLVINAEKLNSGVYFYTFVANDVRLTRKMNVIK